jgi:hypothetical protein
MAGKKKTPPETTTTKAKNQPSKHQATKPAAQDKPPKLSALDAAARVLAETRQAMTCGKLIEAMAAKGYWTSPGGKTPSATLYSAILRELQTKKKEARFRKTERGKFALA